MRMRPLAAFQAGALAFAFLVAGAASGIVPATASALGGRARAASPAAPVRFRGVLSGVAATSGRSAWAVGSTNSLEPLILRWNGTAWERVSSAGIPRGRLLGVAAVSSGSAWAVGTAEGGGTLIARWDGTAWKRVPSPGTGDSRLAGVAAVSSRDAWAVGGDLILHWNGTAWQRERGPGLRGGTLAAVTATSARNAWAVGGHLILHWNGSAWTRVRFRVAGVLNSVAAASSRDAWAAGYQCGAAGGGTCRPLILHWNGTAWKRVPSPNPPSQPLGNWLFGVAATSARNAWAVGGTSITDAGSKTLVLHWNGTAWKRVPSPGPPAGPNLYGVAATSARNAWAVGGTTSNDNGIFNCVILHWNGTTWNQVP